jgi:hypothetical protein
MTRKPLGLSPAMCAIRPSTGQSLGDDKRLFPPVSILTDSSYCLRVKPRGETSTTGIASSFPDFDEGRKRMVVAVVSDLDFRQV